MSDLTSLIIALATLLTAAGGFVMAMKSKNQSVKNTEGIKAVSEDLKAVHTAVNSGLSKQLSNASAAGNLEGRKEQKQEDKDKNSL